MTLKYLLLSLILFLLLALQAQFPLKASRFRRRELLNKMFLHLVLISIGNLFVLLIKCSGVDVQSILAVRSMGLFRLFSIEIQNSGAFFIFCLITLDFAVYWQHRLFHTIPFLWKFHRLHHLDPEIETTSGVRFHPLEIILSFFYKISVCLIFGIKLEVYVLFEVLLVISSLFHHSNIKIPLNLESRIKSLIVTPRYHLIHHGQKSIYMNSNYSFLLSFWDKMFYSFKWLEEEDLEKMVQGVKGREVNTLWEMLMDPFRR